MKRECCRPPHASRGFAALIEILVVAALIMGGAILYMNMMGGAGVGKDVQQELNAVPSTPGVSEPQSLPGRAIRKAVSFECQNNLRQLRMAIEMARTNDADEKYPASLDSLQGTEQIRQCPVCHQPYVYDPATGQVKCPYPDHASY